MADDLDAFFDEVSEVEAKAKEEDEEEREVSQDREESGGEEPPAKKAKFVQSAPVIPRGVVVAAAASSTRKPPTATEPPEPLPGNTTAGPSHSLPTHAASRGPPPPPPPPPLPPPPRPAGGGATTAPAHDPAIRDHVDDWPATGFRLFVGNLGNEVTDDELLRHASGKYPSCTLARVMRDPRTGTSRGYGFLWFGEPLEGARAKRELDQTWLGSRPIRIKKYQAPQATGGSSTATAGPGRKGAAKPTPRYRRRKG